MQLPNKNESVRFLVIGYIVFVILFVAFWVVDDKQLVHQKSVIDEIDIAVRKMRTISEMIETVRARVRLSHSMISAEDVFEKDEIYQDISSLAGNFMQQRDVLESLSLTQAEQQAIKKQYYIYPIVMKALNQVSDLALKDTPKTNTAARDLIDFKIVPLQQKVIDGFLSMQRDIQQSVGLKNQYANEQYEQSQWYRYSLTATIVFLSFFVFVWVSLKLINIEKRLRLTSMLDSLTSIPNRRCFDVTLEKEWQRSIRLSKDISLLMIDIDFFKQYNDLYGHQKGDSCLIKVASLIRASANRVQDLAARYGGEEFVIILPETNAQSSHAVAQGLIKSIEEENIPHAKSSLGRSVTVSIGVSTLVPNDKQKPSDLIELADKALYSAKSNGRNRVETFA